MNRKILLWVGALVLIAGAGGLYFYATRPPPAASAPPPAAVATTPPPAAAPAIANPVPATASAEPLPPLEASDAPLQSALEKLSGAGALAGLLRPEDLVRHIVASVDSLPRTPLDADLRPLRRPSGDFMALGPDDAATVNPRNSGRYEPYVRVLANLDMQALATVYFRFYPLFQQAYRDLGNPDGYFNDRLVEVIDHLLTTPQLSGPLHLLRPNVMYQFADPKLEALSPGQKLLLRLGPAQRRTVLAQLRALRAAVAHPPGH
jgi:hypothetical protein